MIEQEGYLELILGPMFSGKTTRLVQHYKKYTYIGRKVFVINYAEDVRYDNVLLSTHDKIMIPCKFASTISEMESDIKENDIIKYSEALNAISSQPYHFHNWTKYIGADDMLKTFANLARS